MTRYSAVTSQIELERTYVTAPSRVFAAWATADALLRWGAPGAGWDVTLEAFEFEVGGKQITSFTPGNGQVYVNRWRFHDIVPDTRIVSSGSMSIADNALFVGVLTVELEASGSGCLLRLIEQGVFLDGLDQRENHLDGWNSMLERLRLATTSSAELSRA